MVIVTSAFSNETIGVVPCVFPSIHLIDSMMLFLTLHVYTIEYTKYEQTGCALVLYCCSMFPIYCCCSVMSFPCHLMMYLMRSRVFNFIVYDKSKMNVLKVLVFDKYSWMVYQRQCGLIQPSSF